MATCLLRRLHAHAPLLAGIDGPGPGRSRRHHRRSSWLRQAGIRLRLLGGAGIECVDRHRHHRTGCTGNRRPAAAQKCVRVGGAVRIIGDSLAHRHTAVLTAGHGQAADADGFGVLRLSQRRRGAERQCRCVGHRTPRPRTQGRYAVVRAGATFQKCKLLDVPPTSSQSSQPLTRPSQPERSPETIDPQVLIVHRYLSRAQQARVAR